MRYHSSLVIVELTLMEVEVVRDGGRGMIKKRSVIVLLWAIVSRSEA